MLRDGDGVQCSPGTAYVWVSSWERGQQSGPFPKLWPRAGAQHKLPRTLSSSFPQAGPDTQ